MVHLCKYVILHRIFAFVFVHHICTFLFFLCVFSFIASNILVDQRDLVWTIIYYSTELTRFDPHSQCSRDCLPRFHRHNLCVIFVFFLLFLRLPFQISSAKNALSLAAKLMRYADGTACFLTTFSKPVSGCWLACGSRDFSR
ncbi:unnamed protein product, partial [Cylicocyclus nassatus]